MAEEEKKDPDLESEAGSEAGGAGGDAAADDSKEPPKRLVKGDYIIQVHIIEARELKGRDFGDTSDPMCEVRVLGKKKSTSYLKGQLNPIWDERLTWSFSNLEPEELNQGKAIVAVYDANAIRRNVLIGSFEFDLVSIYYRKYHEMFNQWVALIDVTGDNKGAQGFLKVTIVVLGPGDEQKIHTPEELMELGGDLFKPLMPPTIDPIPFLLKVYVYKWEKFVIADRMSRSSDPYIRVEFASDKVKTKKVKKQLTYDLQKALQLPVMEPVLGDTIKVWAKDWDAGLGEDDIIGYANYSWERAKKNEYPCHYVHLYGAPEGRDDHELGDKMNRGIIEGVWYRGTMLLEVTGKELTEEEYDDAKKGVVDVEWNASKAPEIADWVLQIDLYQAVEVLDSEGKFCIEMRIRDLCVQSGFAQCDRGTCEWYTLLGVDTERTLMVGEKRDETGTLPFRFPADIDQCPDVIFYLKRYTGGFTGGEEYISYKRFKWRELVDRGFTTPPEWIEFKPTPIFHELTEAEFPGTVLMGIRAGRAEERGAGVSITARPFLNITADDDEDDDDEDLLDAVLNDDDDAKTRSRGDAATMDNQTETMGKLSVTVLKGEDIPSVDRDGKADPFVEVQVNQDIQKTKVKKDTLKPKWSEKFEFRGVSIHDEVEIRLKDWNRVQGDTLIGIKDNILLTGILRESKAKPGEDFSLNKRFIVESERFRGAKVMVSLQFNYDPREIIHRRKVRAKKEFAWTRNKDQSEFSKMTGVQIMGRPYPKNYEMRIYVYCARDLVPADANGLSDPQLEVAYCGGKARTKIIKNTLNPQWMQELVFSIDVPQPSDYAPRIRCSIYDWDRWSSDDLLCRFFINFPEAKGMRKKGKARWFQTQDLEGNQLPGRVYLAMEFLDPDTDAKPFFFIDHTTFPFDFHFLMIGVRSLKSSLGVSKPQVVTALPIAGELREVATDPSSDPTPKDANFLVTKKVIMDLPKNIELAPVLNLIARDNKFGGIIKNDIGNASLPMDNYMCRVGEDSTDWVVQEMDKEILDENELRAELAAEEIAESREYAAELRVRELALTKVKELTEVRTSLRQYIDERKDYIEDLETRPLEIWTPDQVLQLKMEAAKKKFKLKKPEEAKKEEAREEKAEAKRREEKEEVPDSSAEGGDEEDADAEADALAALDEESEPTELLDEAPEEFDQEALLAAEEEELDNMEIGPAEEEEEEEEAKKKKKLTKKQKKKLAKKKKKEDEKKLKEWDKEGEDFCFDIDSKVPYNPEDFEPEYLKGRPKLGTDWEKMKDKGIVVEPFENIDLHTGQVGGLRMFGADRRQVGTIKGLWMLADNDTGPKNPFGPGLKNLVVTRTVACRLYILGGYIAVATDTDGSSDPYLIIKLGREKESTRGRYKKNTLTPKFHEAFEFITTLPGPSKLNIEVWDWDGIGDDLIGITVIDIEDRWFSRDWRRMRIKPLEQRNLANPRSQASYGKLTLWVDMMSKDDARNEPMVDISLPPTQKYEIRLIVWDAKNVVIKDTLTDQNDLRITGKVKVGPWQEQETDTHWRAKWGKGSWNWRMIFPIELPTDQKSVFMMSMWDQDVFAASDSIGEVNIALDLLLKQAYLQKEEKPRLVLRKDASKRFYLDFTHPNFEGVQGKVKVSMELMTEEEAAKFPAGKGRGDPNTNPYLPPPEGRFRWTWNPIELLRQILGDKCCAKIACLVCLTGIFSIITFFGPQLAINFISSQLEKALFGKQN